MKSLAGQMRAINGCPVVVSQIGVGAYEPAGMSSVFFGRQRSDGQVVLAIYLIDLGCLGVKDSYVRVVSKSELKEIQSKAEANQPMETVQPSTLFSLVEQAVVYARSIGFEPRGDYGKIRPIFGDINPDECTEEFPFGGEDGKPLYIRGPNETLEQATAIRNMLEARLGEDNFNFIVPIHPAGHDAQEFGLPEEFGLPDEFGRDEDTEGLERLDDAG